MTFEIHKWPEEEQRRLGELIAAAVEHAGDALPDNPSTLLAIGAAAPKLGDYLDATGSILMFAATVEEERKSA